MKVTPENIDYVLAHLPTDTQIAQFLSDEQVERENNPEARQPDTPQAGAPEDTSPTQTPRIAPFKPAKNDRTPVAPVAATTTVLTFTEEELALLKEAVN
jgi:hypothetical protein